MCIQQRAADSSGDHHSRALGVWPFRDPRRVRQDAKPRSSPRICAEHTLDERLSRGTLDSLRQRIPEDHPFPPLPPRLLSGLAATG